MSRPTNGATGLTPSLNGAGKYRTWPDGRIPYVIHSSVGAVTRDAVLTAMNNWQTKSEQRVRFEKATANDTARLVVKQTTAPNTSHIGYKAGTVTTVELRPKEHVTVARHELGHVLGLEHEQRRADRAGYIQVKTGNIVGSKYCKNQFSVCDTCLFLGDFDPTSVMLYRTSDLSACRTGPVLLHADGTPIQHKWVLSAGDIAAIAELYGPPPASGADAGGAGAGGSASSAGAGGSGGEAGLGELAGAGGGDGIDQPDVPEAVAGSSNRTSDSGDSSGGCALARRRAQRTSGVLWLLLALLAALRRRR